MSAQPAVDIAPSRRALPDYLPARMINEHVYCPRLFYFEQVEGVFVAQRTYRRRLSPAQASRQERASPLPGRMKSQREPVVVHSITLSSEKHQGDRQAGPWRSSTVAGPPRSITNTVGR